MDLTVEELCLSEEDLEKCRSYNCHPLVFEAIAQHIHDERERERLHGVRAVETQPLVHVLSVSLTSGDEGLAIHGTIHAEFWHQGEKIVHQLYSCDEEMPQFVGTNGLLALKGPDFLSSPDDCSMPLGSSIVVKLSDAKGNDFAQGCFRLDDGIEACGYEEVVRSKPIPCKQSPCLLTLRYTVIPFSVSCRIDMVVIDRKSNERCSRDFIGRIVAKYPSEDCVLFDKQDDKQETEPEWIKNELHLSRCWVAVPAYSTLVLDVDLSKVGTSKKIVGTLKLTPEPCASSDAILLDDYIIRVNGAWFSPDYDYHVKMKEKERMDIEGEDGNSSLPRVQPSPSPAIEIFSVIIGGEFRKSVERQVHGSVEVLSYKQRICYAFKRDEKDALTLCPYDMFIPVLDGSRVIGEFLEMKVDIKDVESLLAIKGTLEWDSRFIGLWHERPVCSLIRGQHGFAAVHYAIFPEAVEANIKVEISTDWIRGDRVRGIGCVEAEYSCFDYSSRYNKDYYRSLLFASHVDGFIHFEKIGGCPGHYCEIPLSRSKMIVPSHSSLVLRIQFRFENDDYTFYKEKMPLLDGVAKIEIGERVKAVKAGDHNLRIQVDWEEIK